METYMKISVLLIILTLLILIQGPEDGLAIRITRRTKTRRQESTRITNNRIKVRRYRGPVYKSSYWKTGMAVGLVYGIASYKTRRRYLRHPYREPTVCFNEDELRNGTYGYFICPEWYQDDDYEYCCGSEGNQRCCTYFGRGPSRSGGSGATGRTVGIVIAVVLVCVIIGVSVYCFNARRGRRGQGQVISKKEQKGAAIAGTHEQMIPLNKTSGPTTYPGSSTPTPPQYGGYGTGVYNPDMSYDPNAAGYPPGAAVPPYPNSYGDVRFSGDVMKHPLPQGDMSTGFPYPHEQGSGGQGIGFTYGDPNTIAGPPYPPVQPVGAAPPYPTT